MYRILAANLSTTKTGREYNYTRQVKKCITFLHFTSPKGVPDTVRIYSYILTVSYSITSIMAGLNSKFFATTSKPPATIRAL